MEVSADNSFPDFRSPFPVPRSPFPVLVTSKRKFKRMLSFLFVEEGKLFIKKSSFEEFNLVFFTTERVVYFEMPPRQ